MKRSHVVELRILPAVAAAALAMGCGSPGNQRAVDRYCMDQTKMLVERAKCEEDAALAASAARLGHPYLPLYGWVYGPARGGWRPGMHVGGNPLFSRTLPGAPILEHSGAVRGGFGSSARPTAS